MHVRPGATVNGSILSAEEESKGARVRPTIPQGLSFGPKTSFKKRTILTKSGGRVRFVDHW